MTKGQLERQVERLRKALLSLVYKDEDGRWRVGTYGDCDVTPNVKPALEYKPRS